MSIHFELPQDKIADFCQRWKVEELALFGSALRDDFGPKSDVDLLVSFAEDARPTLFDMVEMQQELESMLDRARFVSTSPRTIDPVLYIF